MKHYDILLAQHYTWMFGVSFRAKVDEQRAVLEALGIRPGRHGIALDLGSGPGFQSIALAELGFSPVLAIDTCQALLDELEAQKGSLPIEAIAADLRGLEQLASPNAADVIVCMGDTLTHLESKSDVAVVLAKAREVLRPGGQLCLTYRDLTPEPVGFDRILPIHADEDRIMFCRLEYKPEYVIVNDLVQTRQADRWKLSKSSYRKLRLAPSALAAALVSLGFRVTKNTPFGRMHAIVAERH